MQANQVILDVLKLSLQLKQLIWIFKFDLEHFLGFAFSISVDELDYFILFVGYGYVNFTLPRELVMHDYTSCDYYYYYGLTNTPRLI